MSNQGPNTEKGHARKVEDTKGVIRRRIPQKDRQE
jgi:hypothetical protein